MHIRRFDRSWIVGDAIGLRSGRDVIAELLGDIDTDAVFK